VVVVSLFELLGEESVDCVDCTGDEVSGLTIVVFLMESGVVLVDWTFELVVIESCWDIGFAEFELWFSVDLSVGAIAPFAPFALLDPVLLALVLLG